MNTLDRLVSNPLGALSVLTLAAFLEAWGDFFLSGSSTVPRDSAAYLPSWPEPSYWQHMVQ